MPSSLPPSGLRARVGNRSIHWPLLRPRLLAQWRGATRPLRYYAPLWCDATDLATAVTELGLTVVFTENSAKPHAYAQIIG